MESDNANPAAVAYAFTIDDAAIEATIQPVALFADMTIQGNFSGPEETETVETTAAPATAVATSAIDPKWIAVLAIAVIVIGAVAIWQRQQ